jgi:Tol biopolymer transport system component
LFAPGIVSTGLDELNAVFSPDGLEFFFSAKLPGAAQHTMLTMRSVDGRWTDPEVLPFSGSYPDADPAFSADGERLFFVSQRPRSGTGPAKDWDIWVVDREGDGWGRPVPLGPPVNTDLHEIHPTSTQDGVLYFSSNRPGGFGNFDLYRAEPEPEGGGYGEVINLGASLNTPRGEGDVFVSPDGAYLVFSGSRPDGSGRNDLWVSFRESEARWTQPTNLGPRVNSAGIEFTPAVTPDGLFLFFTSYRGALPHGGRVVEPYNDITALYSAPENGLGDIYWVDASVISAARRRQSR